MLPYGLLCKSGAGWVKSTPWRPKGREAPSIKLKQPFHAGRTLVINETNSRRTFGSGAPVTCFFTITI